MAIDVSSIVSEYGAYYIAGNKNTARLRKTMRNGFDSRSFFTPVNTEDSIYEMASSRLSEVLQQFQKKFTPKGDLTFTPEPIPTYRMKIDVAEYPDDIMRTWLEFLGASDLDRTTWPLVRWWIEEHLVAQTYEDLEMKAIYNGIYLAPTTNVAGQADRVMNGFKKLVNDAVASEKIPAGNVLNTGALSTTPATFVGQIIDFIKQVDAKYRNTVQMNLAISNDYQMLWRQGILEKYNISNTTMPDANLNRVPFAENISLSFLPSMNGSDKLVLTPKANALMPIKHMQNLGNFKVGAYNPREVSAYTDFQIGLGFVLYDEVWTNDRDTAS